MLLGSKSSSHVFGRPVITLRRPCCVPTFSRSRSASASSLTGIVYCVGGKGKTASVKLEDRAGNSFLCRASRARAKQLLEHMWGAPIRVIGRGRWLRGSDGNWRLLAFHIHDFAPLEQESLSDTVARLRAIGGKWKERPDPIGELMAERAAK